MPVLVISTVESELHDDEWDDFLARTPGGDLVQSAAWGRVKHSAGMEIQRVLVRHEGTLVGGAQILVRRLGPFGSVAYVPYGPVVAPQAADDVVVSLVEQLLSQVRRARIRALFVQPPEGGDRVGSVLRSNGFRPTAVGVAPSATIHIDLRLDPEQLLAQMSKHARQEFRKSQREPVKVRQASRGDLGSFYELYCCTAARQGFEPLSFRYLESLWDELHPLGLAEVFLADVDGTDVAANLVTVFGGTVTGRFLGFDPDRLSQRLRPNEAVVWAIIRWAAERGAKTLDTGGIARADALNPKAGSAAHKARLGGTAILYPEPLELIPNLALRSAFGAVQSSRMVQRFEGRWRTKTRPSRSAPRAASTPQAYTTRVTRNITPDEAQAWDRFVASVDQSDVAQLHSWSRVRSSAGFSAMYVFVYKSGVLVAGTQVLLRRLPVLGALGYVSHGPVIAEGLDDRPAVCAAVCSGLTALMRTDRVRVLFVQPPVGADDASAELARLGFRTSVAGIAPPASLRIDLTATEDELRAHLNRGVRKWTRRWPERGVTVRVGTEDDLSLLADLLAQSAEHQGYESMSFDYLRRLYGALAPDGHAVLFVGEANGQPVAVNLLTSCAGTLRGRLVGFDRRSDAAHLNVPHAIKWNAMLWAKQHGFRWFDFGGIDLDVAQTLLAGREINDQTVSGGDRFKLAFGASPYILPPAMEFARPVQLLEAYRVVQESERGREQVDKARRRLRGGRSPLQ